MKNFKKILCVVLTVLICFSLSGCNFIDDMRDAQIHYNDDGNLVYDEKEYILLPDCSAFSPGVGTVNYLYITETDVPVLLSTFIGNEATITEDKLFISIKHEDYTSTHFAREDVFDKIVNRINSGNYFDGYCFYYQYYDKNYEWQEKYTIINDKQKEAIEGTISLAYPEDVDVDLMYPYHKMDLYLCSKDLYFKEFTVSIFKTDSKLYVSYDYGEDGTKVYIVPDEYIDTINGLIEIYENLQPNNYDGEWDAE